MIVPGFSSGIYPVTFADLKNMPQKILVIDDEEMITRTLLNLLSRQGYDVTLAQSGKEALDKVKDNEFNLIISDIRMPEMDGIETIKQIRAYLKRMRRNLVPEVLITGYADIDRYEKAGELKIADYIYKPFDREEFLAVVKKNLE